MTEIILAIALSAAAFMQLPANSPTAEAERQERLRVAFSRHLWRKTICRVTP